MHTVALACEGGHSKRTVSLWCTREFDERSGEGVEVVRDDIEGKAFDMEGCSGLGAVPLYAVGGWVDGEAATLEPLPCRLPGCAVADRGGHEARKGMHHSSPGDLLLDDLQLPLAGADSAGDGDSEVVLGAKCGESVGEVGQVLGHDHSGASRECAATDGDGGFEWLRCFVEECGGARGQVGKAPA